MWKITSSNRGKEINRNTILVIKEEDLTITATITIRIIIISRREKNFSTVLLTVL